MQNRTCALFFNSRVDLRSNSNRSAFVEKREDKQKKYRLFPKISAIPHRQMHSTTSPAGQLSSHNKIGETPGNF